MTQQAEKEIQKEETYPIVLRDPPLVRQVLKEQLQEETVRKLSINMDGNLTLYEFQKIMGPWAKIKSSMARYAPGPDGASVIFELADAMGNYNVGYAGENISWHQRVVQVMDNKNNEYRPITTENISLAAARFLVNMSSYIVYDPTMITDQEVREAVEQAGLKLEDFARQ